MNRLLSLATLGVTMVVSSTSFAQSTEAGASAIVEGAGVKVGEGTVIHPILGIESGVVQNVFYEDNQTKVAGLLRIIGEVAVGSLPAERMQMPSDDAPQTENFGDLAFRAEGHLQYEEYLSGSDDVRAQRGVSGYLSAHGIVFPKQTWQFGFSDVYARSIRPVNFESSDNVDRDVNVLGLELRFRPRGRTIQGLLGYTNMIDVFEADSQQFADRMSNKLHLNVGWQWLPVTRLYSDTTFGIVGGIGSASTRPTSFPLKTYVGIASALTVKTAVNARVGFGKGFYGGEDFTNVIGGVTFSWRPSPELRFSALYDYDFEDSINANFYRDHAFKVRADYRRDRLTITGSADMRLRLYKGVIEEVMATDRDRNDVIFGVGAGAIYNFQGWIAATLDYQLSIDQTDFRYSPDVMTIDDPSYVRQTVMLGVRAAY